MRTRDLRDKVKSGLAAGIHLRSKALIPKTIEEIGRGPATYVKIGAFTFEAIQFALKPSAERLSAESIRQQAHSWVRALRFEGGILDGSRVDLSNEMNCLIGIRGSGKSAAPECLRYALQLPLPGILRRSWDLSFTSKSWSDLPSAVGGKVVVEAEDAQGRCFEVRRILNERSDVYFDGELRPGVRIPIKNPLFFGQKELVKRGEGSERELVERLLEQNWMRLGARLRPSGNGSWTCLPTSTS